MFVGGGCCCFAFAAAVVGLTGLPIFFGALSRDDAGLVADGRGMIGAFGSSRGAGSADPSTCISPLSSLELFCAISVADASFSSISGFPELLLELLLGFSKLLRGLVGVGDGSRDESLFSSSSSVSIGSIVGYIPGISGSSSTSSGCSSSISGAVGIGESYCAILASCAISSGARRSTDSSSDISSVSSPKLCRSVGCVRVAIWTGESFMEGLPSSDSVYSRTGEASAGSVGCSIELSGGCCTSFERSACSFDALCVGTCSD